MSNRTTVTREGPFFDCRAGDTVRPALGNTSHEVHNRNMAQADGSYNLPPTFRQPTEPKGSIYQ